MNRKKIIEFMLPAICVLLCALSGWAKTYDVFLKDMPPYTVPTNLDINVGDTVVWRNEGPTLAHVVADENVEMNSNDITVGKIWQYTFQKAGVYSYLCLRHFFMRGRITVRDSEGSSERKLDFPYQSAFKDFVVPTEKSVPRMIISNGARREIWFTEGGGGFYGFEDIPPQNKLGKLEASGRITEFSTPTGESGGQNIGVDSLVMDKKGNIWFTERLAGKIGRLDPTGRITEFSLSSPKSEPLGIDIDKKGNIWVALRYANKIAQLTPEGKLTEIELPEPDSEPRTVFVDSKNRVWYTARAANEIGYYDTVAKKIFRMQIPTTNARPAGMCEAADGTIYFVEMVGNKIAKITGDQITEFNIPTKFSGAFKIAVDAHNNLWFTQVISNSIGRFDTKSHEFMEFKIPNEDSRPGGIAIDLKGQIWFTQQKGNRIGMLDPVNAVALYKKHLQQPTPEPRSSMPHDHSPGPVQNPGQHPGAGKPGTPPIEIKIEDYNVPTAYASPGNNLIEDDQEWLWFTELHGNKVGAINLRTKKFKEFPLPTPISMPVGLTRDLEGKFWITQFRGNSLASLDPKNGAIEEYRIPTDIALPAGITVDEKNQIWFTQLGANSIARFDGNLKKFESYEMPRPESGPLQVVADNKGALWISASEERGNYLARFDLKQKKFEAFDLPTPNASPIGLLVDDGSIWIAEGGARKLARFFVGSKTWEEYLIPDEKSEPVKMAKDAEGNIWLTDGGGLGSVGGNSILIFYTGDKTFASLRLKNKAAKPMAIIAASDGNIWFTQQGANLISRAYK